MVRTGVTDRVRSRWKASEECFGRFLAWLDGGNDTTGDEFLRLRSRLVTYFERKGCDDPDELADETLERVNRRLDEAGQIDTETPAKFCYITAKFVFLEYLRSSQRKEDHLDGADLERIGSTDSVDETEHKERLSRCLDRCLANLNAEDRELIVGYYFGERRTKIDHRRTVAAKLGITPNALAIRACRIRERLESCIVSCTDDLK